MLSLFGKSKSSDSKSDSDLADLLEKCKKQIVELRTEISKRKDAARDALKKVFDGSDESDSKSEDSSKSKLSPATFEMKFQCRRAVDGVNGRITALDFGPIESDRLISVFNNGKLLICKASNGSKTHHIKLSHPWNMTCAVSPSGEWVASAGLDNVATLHKVPDKTGSTCARDYDTHNRVELIQHEGYIQKLAFTDSDTHLITASGDSTCVYWDVEYSRPTAILKEHSCDCQAVDVCPTNPLLVATGASDTLVKIWDLRLSCKTSMFSFNDHQNDVNCIKWFPNGEAMGSGSEDAVVLFHDLRSVACLAEYKDPALFEAIESIDFSHSGRMLFGTADTNVIVWDTLDTAVIDILEHKQRASCLQISPDGYALATGSWDSQLRTWA